MTLDNLLLMVPFTALVGGLIMAFYRLLIGPSLADRVVAMDLMAAMAISIIAFFAIVTDEAVLLDVVAVVALTSFLGTIAFAYYIEVRKT
ncbi:monovalent cation/H+ antiporter complex subunit F [Aggregatilinea lenta]|uniref:monovalent cation/H+ antiporter complex subunit F n=1 Tax=Aggregatilinea lenta TaxID=913108 RepID=UPI000E5A6774|nr:monovalent cation/H+ antiporter complex subunit F [Aggregatilinea lenta]